MKKSFSNILLAIYLISYAFCETTSLEIDQNPNLSLNPQDIPIFYDNNPLTDLKAFTIITSFPVKNAEIQKKIGQTVEKTLTRIGDVVHLKDNDMQGFGAGNVLIVQLGNVTGWDGNEMPTSRLSLSIETHVSLDKTDIKTFPMVWSINTFIPGNIDSGSEGNLTKAVQKLVGDFVQSYQYVNKNLTKRPVFYTYD